MKKTLVTLLFFGLIPFLGYSQEFSYRPENPQAGQEITVNFQPSSLVPYRFTAYQMVNLSPEEVDLTTSRSRGVYTLTLTTKSDAGFVYFVATSNKVPDSNNGEGYYIELFENGKPKKGANLAKAYFYQYYGDEAGIENDRDRALQAVERELSFHPDNRQAKTTYFRLLLVADNEKAIDELNEEISATKALELTTEADYQYLSTLYSLVKDKDLQKQTDEEKKVKFPEGEWLASETINLYYNENDLVKKKEMLAEIEQNINTKPNWEKSKPLLKTLQGYLLRNYIDAGDWAAYQNGLKEYDFNIDNAKNQNELYTILYNYNNAAWKMQEAGENLVFAKELMEIGTQKAKEDWDSAVADRKSDKTRNNAKNIYGMFADTYAMVLLANNEPERGFELAKEAAFNVGDGKDEDYNTTYAKLAGKILHPTEYKEALENFVKDGKASVFIKDELETIYTGTNGTRDGFDAYLAELELESKKKLKEDLLAKMQNKPAPKFSLVNLEGKEVKLEELKGKTVIVDFWATWCGPCIASFPGMKMAQEKYQENENVKFVFINSWEQGENIETKVADFIAKSNYPFDVLYDKGDKVIGAYGVSGIPTKFIVDGNGKIRFTSVGYGGSPDKLVDEISMMIEIIGEE